MTFFSVYSIICEILVTILILAIPSEANSQVFLGLSTNRLAILFLVFICFVISNGLAFISLTRKGPYSQLSKFFEFKSDLVSFFLFFFAILFTGVFLCSFVNGLRSNPAIDRLRPIFILFALIFTGVSLYDIFIYHHTPWLAPSNYLCLLKRHVENFLGFISKTFAGKKILFLVMALCFPLLFHVAITYSFPSGFSGLYTLMADEISQSGFSLPLSVPYYGPGGIPFAYPPLGFYLMAIITSVFRIPDFEYLRFAPAIFMWLSMVPLSLITLEFTKSRAAAIIASVLVAGSQRIFFLQGTSGGIVRGLAFLFALTAIYFFILADQRKQKIKFAAIAGVFIGLTGLTHLSYLQFVVLFVIAYFLPRLFSKSNWLITLIAGNTAILIVTPWVMTMIFRFGWGIFEGAFQSHGNDWLVLMLQDTRRIIPWSEYSLIPLFDARFLWGMILLGLIFSIATKKTTLALWFGLILLSSSESDRYLFTVGAVAIGLIISALYHHLRASEQEKAPPWRSFLFLFITTILFYQDGWNAITTSNRPDINQDTLAVANYVKQNTPAESTYLVVVPTQEAEWYPYLLERVPVIASWGGEWIGTYTNNLERLSNLESCMASQSVSCLEDTILQLPFPPDLLITRTNEAVLNQDITSAHSWKLKYQNETYILWTK